MSSRLGRPGPPGPRGPNAVAGGTSANQPAVVAALPGSPADGDEIVYQNAAMATAGVAWRLKYRAAVTDWEFIGGPPLIATVITSEGTTSTTYAALATAGPSVTVPLAGDYIVEQEAEVFSSASSQNLTMSYDIGGTGAVDGDRLIDTTAAASAPRNIRRRARKALTAVALVSKYKTNAGTSTFANRTISILPIRLDG